MMESTWVKMGAYEREEKIGKGTFILSTDLYYHWLKERK